VKTTRIYRAKIGEIEVEVEVEDEVETQVQRVDVVG
jgi:hypothetical protein